MGLPGGLVLRGAGPADLAQIQDLLAARGDAADAEDLALVCADPDAGWRGCAVVADGSRVVSTATLLDEHLTVAVPGGPDRVVLASGQVEMVATDRAYEGRGCVRALMGWAHEESARRRHVVQLMVGIPYFYRLFGYSYAIDVPPSRVIGAAPSMPPGVTVRAAVPGDLPAMAALQDAVQRGVDVAMPHSPACWRWLLARSGSRHWVVERDRAVIGTGRSSPPGEDAELSEVAVVEPVAAAALVAHVGAPLAVATRPGTALDALLDELAEPPAPGWRNRYYVRIPDPVPLLSALRPVLDARLAGAGTELPAEIVLSFFGSHLRMPVRAGRLGEPVAGGTMQAPYEAGGAGIAPDHLAEVLFGPRGIAGRPGERPDVYAGRHAEVMAALFPPQTSDVLTFYR